jgi:methyl-accepting chemotaxis protein
MLRNAKIGVKLGLGFGVLLGVILLISVVAIYDMVSLNSKINEVFDIHYEKEDHVVTIQILLYKTSEVRERISGMQDMAQIQTLKSVMDEFDKEAEDVFREYSTTVPDRGIERNLFTDFSRARSEYLSVVATMDRHLSLGDMEMFRMELSGDYVSKKETYSALLNDLADHLYDNVMESAVALNETIHRLIMVLLIIVLTGFIIAIFFAVMVTRMITLPINECLQMADNLSEGKTNLTVHVASVDETGKLAAAMQKMIKSIHTLYDDATYLSNEAVAGKLTARADVGKHKGDYAKIVSGINDTLDAIVMPIREVMSVMDKISNKDLTARVIGEYQGELDTFKQNINLAGESLEESMIQVGMIVEQISAASSEISSGAQTLAEVTSEQASSLEEISASLGDINSLTTRNVSSTKAGLTLSDHAVKAVEEGNGFMEQMNTAMAAILKSSTETGNIIKTIDEIAFQTNLLALNASVEAARAGEAGKGFAVVADEVKNLATRSSKAANNTNELIDQATKSSEMGSKIVEQVSKSFIEMKEQFNKVKSIVSEIANSSDDQAQGVNQISTGVHEMNRVTQQNAANAQQSAAAAQELHSSIAELKGMLNRYILSDSPSAPVKRTSTTLNVTGERATPKLLPKKTAEIAPETVSPTDLLDSDFEDF